MIGIILLFTFSCFVCAGIGFYVGGSIRASQLPIRFQQNAVQLAREHIVHQVLLLQDETGCIKASDVRMLLDDDSVGG